MRQIPRAVLFVAWGDEYCCHVRDCMSAPDFPDYPVYLITDRETSTASLPPDVSVTRLDFELTWKTRKAEMVRGFPDRDMTFLFLDTDVTILGDLSLGFEKAEQFGMAMAQAAHYSMDHFKEFSKIMVQEGVTPKGQLLYNSGVIFFRLIPEVRRVFALFHRLALRYPDALWSDQPYLTLAVEKLGFNPYTLTTGYNHRAFGELVSGEIRIWHSRHKVPANVNELKPVFPRVFDGNRMVEHHPPKP